MDMESFDGGVFGISLAEASAMDPQQRALMECTYLVFMNAGYTMNGLRGMNCGVFVAVTGGGSASRRVLESVDCGGMQETSVYDAKSATPSIAAGRISYVFDLEGSNNAFDTACSSSLVAMHAAISSLESGECNVALVVGVNQLFDPSVFVAFAKAGMLSATGHCHTWDASADGYLRGEGGHQMLVLRSSILTLRRVLRVMISWLSYQELYHRCGRLQVKKRVSCL